jgi:predicted membrane protein
MEFKKLFQSLKPLEIGLLVVFIIYIVFPIQTPDFLASSVDSSLGMLSIFIITIYLFLNFNPIVAVVYIYVGYELLRRSSQKTGKVTIMQYTPTQSKKDQEMKDMNPLQEKTLEEEIVEQMAPIGHSDANVYIDTSFKPMADKLKEGSLYN